jgi:glycosyltransferase involved in cell wall biosynthesis
VSVRPLIVDLGRDYRGGQHQALLLLQGLRARGHAPELITLRDSLLSRRAKDAGVPVYGIAPGNRRIGAAFEIRRAVSSGRAHLVHANEPHALTAAWLARAHRSVPVVVSRRIALPLSSSSFSRARYRAASRIVAVSRFVEQSVFRSGFPREQIAVIYDGVEIPGEISASQRASARAAFSISPNTTCIGNVAAFVPEKGHALLFRAFAKLRTRFPECVLLLRGEGPEREHLQKLAQDLQISDTIKFLGPASDIGEVLAATDIFAFPSHEEPLGSALLAAMANCLPVVAIARGGIPEAVESEKNGLLVDSLDPDAFAAALARLLANPAEACRFGATARETVAAHFSAEKMVNATLHLYTGLPLHTPQPHNS